MHQSNSKREKERRLIVSQADDLQEINVACKITVIDYELHRLKTDVAVQQETRQSISKRETLHLLLAVEKGQ